MDIRNKKLFLLDLDGTLYLGDQLFEGTLPFLQYLSERGRRYLFITNNSSRSVADYVEKLRCLGISAQAEDFVTSAEVAGRYLSRRYLKQKVFVLGTASLVREMASYGVQVVNRYEPDVQCLLAGYDTELTYAKLEEACKILTATGAEFIATNPDLVCPTGYGYAPDCGSLCAMLENATGKKPRYLGKPLPDMIDLALQKTGLSRRDAVLVGDRMYTDIACGKNARISAALVLSGETKREDLHKFPYRPDAIYRDILEMYREISG